MAENWNENGFTGVRAIKLSHGRNHGDGAIGIFQAIYDNHGKNYEGDTHGTNPSGFVKENIPLDFPAEYITKVSGRIGKSTLVPGTDVVRCLKIETNKRPQGIGTYGVVDGTPFEHRIEGRERIVGFSGSSGNLLNSIDINKTNA